MADLSAFGGDHGRVEDTYEGNERAEREVTEEERQTGILIEERDALPSWCSFCTMGRTRFADRPRCSLKIEETVRHVLLYRLSLLLLHRRD